MVDNPGQVEAAVRPTLAAVVERPVPAERSPRPTGQADQAVSLEMQQILVLRTAATQTLGQEQLAVRTGRLQATPAVGILNLALEIPMAWEERGEHRSRLALSPATRDPGLMLANRMEICRMILPL